MDKVDKANKKAQIVINRIKTDNEKLKVIIENVNLC